jgi:transcription elongation factor GreB
VLVGRAGSNLHGGAGRTEPASYASGVSKAFTRDDRPDEPVIVRHRPALPPGVPNYLTDGGLAALRAELAAAPPGARRSELEHKLATAVVPAPPADRDEIRFGARVELRAEDGQQRQVRIVGVDEAAPAKGAIVFVAPLARALLGRRAGDVVTVRTPGGNEQLEVVGVDYPTAP